MFIDMKRNCLYYIVLCLAFCALACSSPEAGGGPDDMYASLEKVTYAASDEIFPNPERGFFSHLEISSDGAQSPISKDL